MTTVHTGASSLTATGTLTSAGTLVYNGIGHAVLSCVATLSAEGHGYVHGRCIMTGEATLTATGARARTHEGAAVLAAGGLL